MSRFVRVRQVAARALRYGYQYPQRHAQDQHLPPSERPHYHLVDLHEAFVFVALAMLTGVLGNAPYDVLKTVCRRILQQLQPKRPAEREAVSRVVENEREHERFLELLRNYVEDESESFEAMLPYMKYVFRKVEKGNGRSRMSDSEVEALLKANRPNVRQGDFDDFWAAVLPELPADERPVPYPIKGGGKKAAHKKQHTTAMRTTKCRRNSGGRRAKAAGAQRKRRST
jgi:hypothetical protein